MKNGYTLENEKPNIHFYGKMWNYPIIWLKKINAIKKEIEFV